MTPVETYRYGRARMLELVADCDVDTPVAACPGWRVRDVVAHVTGIAADFLAGRLPAGDLEAWTAAQVADRRERDWPEVLSEWDALAPRFEAAMAGPLAAGSSRLAADVVSHGFDIANAIGRTDRRRGPAVDAALDTFVDLLGSRLGTGAGRVTVQAGAVSRTAGVAPPDAALSADPFEALRALSGRRTEAEIRQLDWQGDLDAVMDRLSPYPWPVRSLGEADGPPGR